MALMVRFGGTRVYITIAESRDNRASSPSPHMRSSSDASALLLTVNYKSEQSTLELLSSLERLNRFESLDVVIVDNRSGEENISRLRHAVAPHSNVELLVSENNRGYFGAARFGLDHFLAQGHELPEWIIVCNHDVLIPDPDFLIRLRSQDWQQPGVVAPKIQIAETGLDQNPFMKRRPSWLRRLELRVAYSNYGLAMVWDWLSRTKRRFRRRSLQESTLTAIYAAHGSFIIFSRRFFEAGGYLDNELFLYGEEIAVAETCRSLALPIIFASDLCILHDEHTSTGRLISRFSYECQKKSLQHLRVTYFANTRKSRSKVGFGSVGLPSE